MTQENPLEDVGPPLSRQKIAELEAQLGVALPDDYRQFLLESNGGRPKRGFFQFHYGPAPEWMAEKWRAKWEEHQERWIDDFFVIDDNLARPDRSDPHTLAFWRAADWLMLPPDVLPVAAVTRDDVLLIYIRGPRRGEVHLLCSDYLDAKEEATEQDVQGAIRFVARTFGEFLDGLYEAD